MAIDKTKYAADVSGSATNIKTSLGEFEIRDANAQDKINTLATEVADNYTTTENLNTALADYAKTTDISTSYTSNDTFNALSARVGTLEDKLELSLSEIVISGVDDTSLNSCLALGLNIFSNATLLNTEYRDASSNIVLVQTLTYEHLTYVRYSTEYDTENGTATFSAWR